MNNVPLSPGQLYIFKEVAVGRTYADVAQSIGKSESTIKNTLSSIREVLGAVSTIHAIVIMDDTYPGWRPRI